MKGKYTEIEVGKILNLWRVDRREPQKVRVVKIIDKDAGEVESASGGLMDYYSFDRTMGVWECNLHPIE